MIRITISSSAAFEGAAHQHPSCAAAPPPPTASTCRTALAEPETSACKIAESRDNTMRVLARSGRALDERDGLLLQRRGDRAELDSEKNEGRK